MSNNTVQFNEVQAKERTVYYKGHNVVLSYEPAKKRWHWEFEYTHRQLFEGTAKTLKRAEAEAKKKLDLLT